MSERSERALRKEDEHTRDESREIATDIMATSTTELTLFHSIRLGRLVWFARASLKMCTISLRSAAENDPWHFGTLHVSMMSLFRCATGDDWTDVMYINIYGCDLYGYVDDDKMAAMCTQPVARGVISAIYFVIFQTIGGLVLLTLFIGVVTTSMEEATANQESEADLDRRVDEFSSDVGLTAITVSNYRKVFGLLDVDNGGTIEEDELMAGLNAIGKSPTVMQLRNLMKEGEHPAKWLLYPLLN